MKSSIFSAMRALCAAGLLALSTVTGAMDLAGEDTDLFLTNPAISAEVPNVLIILDNTTNWAQQAEHWPAVVDPACVAAGIVDNQQGDAEVCAIYKAISLLTETVNVGLMLFNEQNAGAYVRFPVKSMTLANRTAFQSVLASLKTNGVGADTTSGNANYENPMNDAFRYLNSLATYGGSGTASARADNNGYVSSAKTNFKFTNSGSSCGYDYIIFIGNGFPNANGSYASEMNTAATLLNDAANVTPNTSVIQNTGSNADVWARFMYNYGVKVAPGAYRHVTTYTIDVCKDQCTGTAGTNQGTLLQSMATVSFGRYFRATNVEAITSALNTIFTQVQAVNSVFAATTLPVSINVRGTNLNQVYIGVFKPDAQLSPRWLGNLKQYELGVANATTGQLQLIDATNTPAVNLNTGFIANTAKSFWTATSTFWSYRAPFRNTDAGGASDSPDGDLVEKGGAAEQVRVVYAKPDFDAAQTRNIYTCTGACLTTTGTSLSGTLFNAANSDISSTLLGTFATVNVSSLTAAGQTATATATSHGFSAGNQVTISGAVPTIYNGTYSILTAATNSFTYSLAPNTPDTTHAYVTLNTFSSSGLNVSTDLITVNGSTPNDYDGTDKAISAVVGQPNQVSYSLSTTPLSAASGYTVTAKKLISNTANSTNLVWSSGPATSNVTVTRAGHGYAVGDVVTISGVTDSGGTLQTALNGPFAVTQSDNLTTNTSFKYSAIGTPSGGAVTSATATFTSGVPSGWGNGTVVTISGATEDNYNKSNVSITNVNSTTGTFDYTTNGTVAANATVPGSVVRTIASDTSTWTVSAGAVTGTGANKKILLTLRSGRFSGQALRRLVTADTLTIANCTYNIGSSGGVNKPCAGLTISAISGNSDVTAAATANNFADLSSTTVTVTLNLLAADNPSQLNSVAVVTTGAAAGNTLPTNATTLAFTGATTSAAVALSGIVKGVVTVNAYGTVYASKPGDLTSKVTSIANQGLATGTITAGLATNADPDERANLIAWVRGLDNKDNENMNSDATDVRASVHGDVLHSRPAVINYNRGTDDNDVYIFYGANDGMFHAIKGGRATGAGNEQWAFIAQEHFGKLKRLRNQTPPISSTSPRDYFFDGPIGAYTKDADGNFKLGGTNDKVYVFIGMRRGGRYIYALDVSDPTDPKFLWRKGCPNPTGSTGCDPGFAEMGQSWSEPKLGYVRAFSTTLVLMFGAGYDSPVEDLQPCGITSWDTTGVTGKTAVVFPNVMTAANCGSNLSGGTTTTPTRSMGRGIYMLNALTGAPLWRAVSPNAQSESVTGMTTKTVTGMDYAMPADLAVLKNRSNTGSRGTSGFESVQTGFLDRIYGVDTGGQIWRVDVTDATIANWVVTKLAKVTPTSGTTSASMRKFMFSPDVVYSTDTDGTTYDAVLLGSGDREHPFDQTVANRFYMFKDRNPGTITPAMLVSPNTPPATILETNLFDVTNNCLQTASTCSTGQTQATAAADLLAAKGWIMQLANSGEKTIATATTSAGTVIFNTNEPKQDNVSGTAVNVGANAGNFCTSDLGTARQYGINYQNAVSNNIFTALPSQFQSTSGRFATFAGGGFLPAPVPVVVSIGGKFYQTVISGVQATNPGGLALQTRVRTYWYKKTN